MFKLYDNGYRKLLTEKKGVLNSDLKVAFINTTFNPVRSNLDEATLTPNRASPTNFSITDPGVISAESISLTAADINVIVNDFTTDVGSIAVIVDSADGEPYGYLNVSPLSQEDANTGFELEWVDDVVGTLRFNNKYKALKSGYLNFYSSDVNGLNIAEQGRIAIVSYNSTHNQQTVYNIVKDAETMQGVYNLAPFTKVTSNHILNNLNVVGQKMTAARTIIDTGTGNTYNSCYIIFYVQKPGTNADSDAIPFAIFTGDDEYIESFTSRINLKITNGIIELQ